MEEELKKLTKEELLSMVEEFEHYPSVTEDDDKDYILSYLKDESCTISEKEIAEYLLKNHAEIIKDNVSLYYEFMSSIQKLDYKDILNTAFKARNKVVEEYLFIDLSREDLSNFETATSIDGNFVINQSIFDVKDTLKPLHDYIEEIKNSDGYKKYVAELKETIQNQNKEATTQNSKDEPLNKIVEQYEKSLNKELPQDQNEDSVKSKIRKNR